MPPCPLAQVKGITKRLLGRQVSRLDSRILRDTDRSSVRAC